MDEGVFGIPLIDGDSFQTCPEIKFGVGLQIAGGSLDIGEFGRVFARDDQPEMMPVVLAPLSENPMIDLIALSAKHPGRITIFGHAVAAEIGEMGGKRRALHPMTHDPGFDHRGARLVSHSPRRREARGAASAKGSLGSRCR